MSAPYKRIQTLVQKLARNPQQLRFGAAVIIFALVGGSILLFSKADTPTASIEAEDGTATSCASTTSDATASNSLAVKFGTCTGGNGTYSFQSSGLTGGGFQNVMVISPFVNPADGTRPYLDGADVSGIQRSLDRGKSWNFVADGHIAAIMWSDTVKGTAYAGVDGGILKTTNWGATWSNTGISGVNFDGNGSYFVASLPGGNEHPRPTGNLFAQDNSGTTKYLWIGTATKGVLQSTDGGQTQSAAALAGNHIRSIASDPNDPDTLYVAIENVPSLNNGDTSNAANSGIWVSHNARSGSMTFTKMGGYGSTSPEELWAIDNNGTTKLYVASGQDGVSMYDSSWHDESTGLAASADWESITGYRDTSGNIVLYVGATNPAVVNGGTHRAAIMKSTNGGASWASISDDSVITLNWNMYGTTTPAFIKTVGNYQDFAANSAWTAAYVAVDPDFTNNIWVAGRGGVWVGQQGTGRTTWQPADDGLMVTVNMVAAVDPANPQHVFDGSMDYVFNYSCDGGNTFTKGSTGATGNITTGDVVTFDANTAASGGNTPVYVAASVRGVDKGEGNILSNPNPCGGGAWTNEGMLAGVSVNDIPAMGVGHDGNDGSGNRVILAGMTNRGLFRKDGANWAKITGGPFDGSTNPANGFFVWKPHTDIVYAFDSTGVWRSSDAGSQGSWVKILAGSSAYSPFNALALDPTNSNYLYVSDGTVKRITNAETSTGVGATTSGTLGGFSGAGSIVVSTGGNLFVQNGGQLMESTNPRAATATAVSFTSVGDAWFSKNDSNIRSMAIGSDNKIYTADNGNGFSVGTP